MTTTSNIHPFAEWAKSRLGEMDAASKVSKAKIGSADEDPRKVASVAITTVKKHHDALNVPDKLERENDVKAWDATIALHEADWDTFEVDVEAYRESFDNKASA